MVADNCLRESKVIWREIIIRVTFKNRINNCVKEGCIEWSLPAAKISVAVYKVANEDCAGC